MNKKLKIALITLVIVLISVISFVGIYQKNVNSYTNIMKDYSLARNLKGSRVVELKVVEELEKTEENTEQETDTEESTDEEATTNFTKEDLKIVKKVLEKRLKDLGSEDFVIEQNKEDGTTTIYLEENDLTDNITGYLAEVGDFKIVDSEDENNVLMTGEDLKVAKVGYAQQQTGTAVYLSIEFNKEGTKKLEDISNTYRTVSEEIEDTEETAEENADNNDETTKEKTITLKIDDTDIMTTSFDKTISNGILQMSIGSVSTSSAEIQQYIMQASGMATLINDGELPIDYTMERNEYVALENANQLIQTAIIVISIIVLLAFVGIIIKYKTNGLKVCITTIGAIAIFALLVRYTNVYIAIESIAAVIILLIVTTILNILILKNKKENNALNSILQAYKKSWKIIVPVLVLSVVLSFIPWTPIASVGMLLLWGLISSVISNFIFTLPMLND